MNSPIGRLSAGTWNACPRSLPASGISKGANLRFVDRPAPVAWQRSVFNGLAQVIVQSTGQPGAIRLTAKSDGLQPATAAISAK